MKPPLLLLSWSGCTWIPIGQHFAEQGETRSPEVVDPVTGCVYPQGELDLTVEEDAPFAPIWLGFQWSLYEDESGLHDHTWVGDPLPASFIVNVYGPEVDLLCSLYYDVEGTERAPEQDLPPDGSIVAAWEVPEGAPVYTDCPKLDRELFGERDLALVLDGGWKFGLGDLGRAQDTVEAIMDDDDVPRSEWERWTLGAYVTYDGQPPDVMGYDISYQAECGEVSLQDGEPDEQRQDPSEPLRPAIHQAHPAYMRAFSAYTGESCEPDVGWDTSWQPNGAIREDVVQASLLIDLVPAAGGGFADFHWDDDDDGVISPQASNVTIGLNDADGDTLCGLSFEAEQAEEIDPGELSSASGTLWRAWRLELEGASSASCTRLDPFTFGTDNPLDISATWSFHVAVGELDLLRDALLEEDPALVDDAFGIYVSLDGEVAEEVGIGFGYDLDGCYSHDPDEELVSPSGISNYVSSHWLSSHYLTFDLDFQ
jgi:hypothetical protein